eukprot:TRINITY_DN44610_c0_g1_i1.p1 TRINITY_DN44610_c0_g1~~TRINITY_DN44610_c0_g1_i1.p1  ORF type:complete len:503 (+),score=85.04 TRINITY_DN44610_c0_g1_i1:68-1510(+)
MIPFRGCCCASRIAVHTAILLMPIAAASSSVIADLEPGTDQIGPALKQKFPWYRSGDELHDAFASLSASGGCPGAEATLSVISKINTADAAGETVQIDVLRIKGLGTQPKLKALFVFGEHARELITGETSLGLAKSLCGQGPNAERAKSVLGDVEFVLVPNANPLSRQQVEKGYYCRRTNEDRVDLNRNWSDEHRDVSKELGDEMYPGPRSFSEPETQILKGLVDGERPDIYLSVHAGAYLLGMPYGYSSSRTPKEQATMMEVLRPISDRFCNGECPYGNLADLIHYENPGCDIDYVYDRLGTPYVFTWEIYVGEAIRAAYRAEARSRRDAVVETDLSDVGSSRQRVNFLERQHLLRNGRAEESSVARVFSEVEGPEATQDIASCLDQFNPRTEEETETVVNTWSSAMLELSAEVFKRRSGAVGRSSKPDTTAVSSAALAGTAAVVAPSTRKLRDDVTSSPLGLRGDMSEESALFDQAFG